MDQTSATEFIKGLGDIREDNETHERLILFRVGNNDSIFAIIHNGSNPLRLETRCDAKLSKVLREKYETVLPSNNMDSSAWNEVICSGQLDEQQVKDLIILSYNLTVKLAQP